VLAIAHRSLPTGSAVPARREDAQLATVAPFPFIVWGADEIRRLLVRRHRSREQAK
jgi:hypothetical protein